MSKIEISEKDLFIGSQVTLTFNLLRSLKNIEFNLSELVTEIY